MGAVLLSFGMCVAGIFFALYRGWVMSLIILAFFPLVALSIALLSKINDRGFKENLVSYSSSAGYAEQALNAIRVVQAFGQEQTEIKSYNKYLNRSRKSGIKSQLRNAIAFAMLQFIIFSFYGYSFYTGSWLVSD